MSKTVEVDTKTFVRFWLVIALLALAVTLVSQAATGLIIVGIAFFLAIAVRPLVAKVEKVIVISPDLSMKRFKKVLYKIVSYNWASACRGWPYRHLGDYHLPSKCTRDA